MPLLLGAHTDGDPLHISDEEMAAGYAFTLKLQSSKSATPRKKPVVPGTKSEIDSRRDISVKRPSMTGLSGSSLPVMSELPAGQFGEQKKPEPKRRRSISTRPTALAPSPRSKKQKFDMLPSVPPNPTTGPHYNPMLQQPPPLQHRSPQQVHRPQQRQHQQQQQIGQQQQRQPQHHQAQRHQQQQQQQQQYTSPQMAQLRMMQQQQQQQSISPRHQQVNAGYSSQSIQQMQQFYPSLHQPPSMAPMHMQGRSGPPHPPPPHQQGMQGSGQQPGPAGQQQRNQGGPNDSQNDPLFMLK
jgi:hypothetical protein